MKAAKTTGHLVIAGCLVSALNLFDARSATAADTAPAGALEEVVVTANKRTENLQDVASAVSVQSGEELVQTGLRSLADYAAEIPGLNVVSGGTPGQNSVSIRGISSNTPTSAVGTYLDDTPVGSSSGWAQGSTTLLDMLPYDLERVEVLRGPQGTLYGEGAMGGLIKYVLKSPDLSEQQTDIGADVSSVRGASDPGYALRARVSMPIVDDVFAMTFSAFGREAPGFMKNNFTGERDTNQTRQYGGRIAALWQPRSDVSVKLTALTQVIDADDSASKHFTSSESVANSAGILLIRPTNPLPDFEQSVPFLSQYTQRMHYVAATLDWEFDAFNFLSATSWSKQESVGKGDITPEYGSLVPLFGGTAGPALADVYTNFGLDKYTQEFRLLSHESERLEWMAGVFATREESFSHYSNDAFTLDYQPYPGFPSPPGLWYGDFPATFEEYAGFGNLTWHVTGALSLTGGARYAYNEQHIEFTILPSPFWPPPLPNNVIIDTDEDVVTWLVSADYRFDDSKMMYARVASGYRPGGPNSPIIGIPLTYDSDSLITYEIGFKSTLLDNRALVNLAVYHTDWKDIQLAAVAPGNLVYRANGGKAVSEGVEVETEFSPLPGLTLGLSGSYIDTHLTSLIPASAFLMTDYQLPNVPKESVSIRASYDFPIAQEWRASFGGVYRYVGAQYTSLVQSPSPVSSPTIRIGNYSVLDVNAGLRKERLSFRLTARNVLDKRSLVGGISSHTNSLTGVQEVLATFLQPRTIELGVDYSF